VTVEAKEGRYEVRITKEGVLYIRKYNEFFLSMYREQIEEHYQYRACLTGRGGRGAEVRR